jgi:hypothetical protein
MHFPSNSEKRHGEFNSWQVSMGQNSACVLESADVIVQRVDDATHIGETVFAASQLTFSVFRPSA